ALGLRADIDALPVDDLIDEDFRSTVPGVAHACGHDVHLTSLIGAGIALQRLHESRPGGLGGRVRLIFQPGEEVTPGGALRVISQGVLDDVPEVYAVHCDPNVDIGKVGSRIGAITAAGDTVIIRLSGHGGHTSRPHLTEDLVYALGKLATDLPSTLGRRIDPRHALSLAWGEISAGPAANAVPSERIPRCAASTSTGGTRSPRCCPNSSTASPARTGSRSTSNTAEASPRWSTRRTRSRSSNPPCAVNSGRTPSS